jgi:hypothetical protein
MPDGHWRRGESEKRKSRESRPHSKEPRVELTLIGGGSTKAGSGRFGKKTGGQKNMGRLRYAAGMDVLKMLAELHQERAQIEEAIVVLERMARGQGKRRGRPPAWMTAASAPKRQGRPPGSKNKPKEKAAERR